MSPRPRYRAPLYKGSGKLEGKAAGSSPGPIRASAGRLQSCLPGRGLTWPWSISRKNKAMRRNPGRRWSRKAVGHTALLLAGDVFAMRGSAAMPWRGRPRSSAISTSWSITPPISRPRTALRRSATNSGNGRSAPTFSGISTWPRRRCATCPRAADHQHRLDHRFGRQQKLDRLRGHQGRHPRLHQVAGPEPGQAQNPRQLRAPGPIWTVLQPVSKAAETVAKHGQKTPMERPGQPEEVSAGVCLFCLRSGLQLHHRRSPYPARRRNHGKLTAFSWVNAIGAVFASFGIAQLT